MEDEGKVKARRMGDNKEMEVARSVGENAGNGIGDYGEGRREREGGVRKGEGQEVWSNQHAIARW